MNTSRFAGDRSQVTYICTISVALHVGLAGSVAAQGADPSKCLKTAPVDEISVGRPRVTKVSLAGVPAIIRAPERVTRAPILLWHGLGPPGDKGALMAALPLDDVQAVKVYLDLPLFGDRMPRGGLSELAQRQKSDYGMEIFAPAVVGAARELPRIVEALGRRFERSSRGGVALFGFSAGGAAVLTALAEKEVPIRSAVILNAPNGLAGGVEAFEATTHTKYSWTAQGRRLAEKTDAIGRASEIARTRRPPALLLIHGLDDEMIPSRSTELIYRALRPFYVSARKEGRLQLDLRVGLNHHWASQEERRVGPLRQRISRWLSCFGTV